MKITPFAVEQWMNEFETTCRWNLGETCVDSLTLEELLEFAGEKDSILKRLLPI